MSEDTRELLAEVERLNDSTTGLTMELELAKLEVNRLTERAERAEKWAEEADKMINKADEVIHELAAQRTEYATKAQKAERALEQIYAFTEQVTGRAARVVEAGPLESRGQSGGETPSGAIQSADSGTTEASRAEVAPNA